MIYDVMGFIIILIVVAVVLTLVVPLFSPERRGNKSQATELKKQLASKSRQLQVARAKLTRIAAGDSGNPTLDAQIALEEISSMELKELES